MKTQSYSRCEAKWLDLTLKSQYLIGDSNENVNLKQFSDPDLHFPPYYVFIFHFEMTLRGGRAIYKLDFHIKPY